MLCLWWRGPPIAQSILCQSEGCDTADGRVDLMLPPPTPATTRQRPCFRGMCVCASGLWVKLIIYCWFIQVSILNWLQEERFIWEALKMIM
mmetsp:Transcript_133225/g.265797  ORF Transcript_133225/g.265797 Transcript_133225/m.265797 type:complete len:91 (-) Transcript_133225:9-281(-)